MRRSSAPDDPALAAIVARAHDADLLEAAAEAKAAFYLRMRAHGIQDLRVLRAFELVPRQDFVPHRYLDLAARGLALPIACGQTLPEPWLAARIVEALAVQPTHRVLEIGAGTGYASAILSHLAADVIALERYQSLAIAAQARLAALDVVNAVVVWGDGLALPASVEAFDRIVAHGVLEVLPESLIDHLAVGGVLVRARAVPTGQAIVRVVKGEDGSLTETIVCPCRLQPIVPGLAATL